MNEAVKNIEIVILGLISIYVLVWAVTAIVVLPMVSYGSYKYIIFIDKQLAKDLNKYYDDNGYMRPKYQASWDVGSRFINYCLMYPFIRKRSTTDSIKFKVFMWWNSLGSWFFWGIFFLVFYLEFLIFLKRLMWCIYYIEEHGKLYLI